MRVEDLLVYGKAHCHSDLIKILLAELLHLNPLELLNHLSDNVNIKIINKYKEEVNALENGKPLQYVLGNVNFYGNNFFINENVLIPRFETEELVEKTKNYIEQLFTNPVDIIDLGCGSGVIGLTLEKKISTKSVDLVDISEKALEVANINRLKLDSNANLIKSDMFEKVTKKYDVIISNPPYIKTNEEIEKIVRDNEPHLALYAGEDGLDCYRKIFKDIKNYMKDKCLIAMEIGMTQGEDIKKLALESIPNNPTIKIEKDLSEKDRMIFIFYNFE